MKLIKISTDHPIVASIPTDLMYSAIVDPFTKETLKIPVNHRLFYIRWYRHIYVPLHVTTTIGKIFYGSNIA